MEQDDDVFEKEMAERLPKLMNLLHAVDDLETGLRQVADILGDLQRQMRYR